jgi:hypothetical protein
MDHIGHTIYSTLDRGNDKTGILGCLPDAYICFSLINFSGLSSSYGVFYSVSAFQLIDFNAPKLDSIRLSHYFLK